MTKSVGRSSAEDYMGDRRDDYDDGREQELTDLYDWVEATAIDVERGRMKPTPEIVAEAERVLARMQELERDGVHDRPAMEAARNLVALLQGSGKSADDADERKNRDAEREGNLATLDRIRRRLDDIDARGASEDRLDEIEAEIDDEDDLDDDQTEERDAIAALRDRLAAQRARGGKPAEDGGSEGGGDVDVRAHERNGKPVRGYSRGKSVGAHLYYR